MSQRRSFTPPGSRPASAVFGGLVIALLCGPLAGLAAARDADPVVEGKKVSRWVQELSVDDMNGRRKAINAIKKAGEVSVPHLIKALKGKKSYYWACTALGEMGAVAWRAAPYLTPWLASKDDRDRNIAYDTLRKLGPKAAPAVAKQLGNRSAKIRSYAALILGGYGPEAKDAIPRLIKALGDKNANVSGNAAQALKRMGKPAVDPLRKALGSKKKSTRLRACEALGGMGELAKPALEDLKSLAASEKVKLIREAAENAVKSIAPGD